MDNPYGNQKRDIPGISQQVGDIAFNRLMPPQYDEFCAAFLGLTSAVTAAYWREKAEMWQEQVDEIRGEEEE